MMMFSESDLRFRFSDDWVVCRYDAHRYYRGWSGAGLKGVDFIAILRDETLVLMEVKNYSIRAAGSRGHTLEAILAQPEILTESFGRKIVDTLTAIDAVRQYWQRHWWRRWALRRYRKRPPRSSEPAFWARVCELAEQPDTCMAVLWLESDAFSPALRQQLETQLTEELPDLASRVYIAQRTAHPFGDCLHAEDTP